MKSTQAMRDFLLTHPRGQALLDRFPSITIPEICIIQSVKCKKNDQPTAVSTCSVLEPDQSGQLRYKAFDKIAKHCKATIEEITITKITTGETIVLNDHSTPTTAQNFFNHITGKKKGDVFAGMFHCDGNERIDDCGLTFNSSFGNLSLQ